MSSSNELLANSFDASKLRQNLVGEDGMFENDKLSFSNRRVDEGCGQRSIAHVAGLLLSVATAPVVSWRDKSLDPIFSKSSSSYNWNMIVPLSYKDVRRKLMSQLRVIESERKQIANIESNEWLYIDELMSDL